MKIKVREIKIGNNLISVMADMHTEFGRKQQRLGIKYADVPRNAIDRDDKKAKKELVRRIVGKMELEGLHENFAIDKGYQLKFDFFTYADEFIKRKAPICETRTYEAVLLKLKKFLGKEKIPCGAITESMMIEFKDFLEAELNGISAYNYFKKLKRMMKEATIAKYFKKNPTENILNKKRKCAEKDSLTVADVKRLSETPCPNEVTGRGFLFSCFTGLRYCDIILLRWENIKDGYIDIVQKKTGERLLIQLHPSAIQLMGERKSAGDLVFRLPSHTGCLKILKRWKEDAGLEAHVTWHVSRVSFATALLTEDVDLLTVSKLLGHKNLLQSQVYLRISDSKKHSAINRLPSIF